MVELGASVARLRLIVLASLLVTGCEDFFGIKQSPSGSGGGAAGGGGAATGPEAGADAPKSNHDAGNADDGPSAPRTRMRFLCADFDDGSSFRGPVDQHEPGGYRQRQRARPERLRVRAGLAPRHLAGRRGLALLRVVACGRGVSRPRHGHPGRTSTSRAAQGVLPRWGTRLDFLDINCSPDGTSQNQYGVLNWGLHSRRIRGHPLRVRRRVHRRGRVTATLDAATPPPTGFTHVRIEATFGAAGSATITVGNLPAVTAPTVNVVPRRARQGAVHGDLRL